MPFRLHWVAYGRDAAEALRSTVASAKDDEPLAPVTVVVPSNHVGVAARRLLASGRVGSCCGRGVGLAAVAFLTPYRLAELLGAPALAAAAAGRCRRRSSPPPCGRRSATLLVSSLQWPVTRRPSGPWSTPTGS